MKFQIINFYHEPRNKDVKLSVGPWYILVSNNQFLHSDLSIRPTTVNPTTNQYDGWFASREKARQALRAYKAKVAAGN